MSRAIGEIALGAALVAADFVLPGIGIAITPAISSMLLGAGAGMVMSGIGSVLTPKPLTGVATATRNPLAAWNVVYGRAKVGGTVIYYEETGTTNVTLHTVLALACHECQSVDSLMFDGQRILLNGSGNSYSPTNNTISISTISRTNGVVSVTLASALPCQTGDTIAIQSVADGTYNGKFTITMSSSTAFTYICGGATGSSSGGNTLTTFPDYGTTVHMETVLGNHSSTFPGLLSATQGLWTASHLCLGRTAVYLRMSYDAKIYANGLPTISFLVHGKNDVFDPRVVTTATTPTFVTTLDSYISRTNDGYNFVIRYPGNTSYTYVVTAMNGSTIIQVSAPITINTGTALLSTTASNGKSFNALVWNLVPGATTYNIYRTAGLTTGLVASGITTQYWNDTGFTGNGASAPANPAPSTNGYTENAALCIADYLAHPIFGFNAVYGTEIPAPQLIAAANICDETIALLAGGTEVLYSCNGGFSLATKRGEILQNLLTSCAGRLVYSGGQFTINPGAWNAPSTAIGDSTASANLIPMIMNQQGLVVNAYNNVQGRGNYFDQSAGTSEGQALMIKGLLDAYQATTNPEALSLANLALSPVLPVLYRGAAIPSNITAASNQIFAPHWLFNVKTPFKSAVINYGQAFTFSGGSATITDPIGGPVRYVYQVTSTTAVLLWNNPYSGLTSGTSYPFTTSSAGNVTTIQLTGASSTFSGSLNIIYSTQTGTPIGVGQPFEAWPDERALAAGEVDSALDTYNWFYRAFSEASTVIGGQWTAAASASLQQAAIVYNVDDNRDWIKTTYTGSPFSDGSRFKYVDPTRLPVPVFGCDLAGNVVINAPASGNLQIQYGNASILDTYNTGDSTSITIGSNIAMPVTFFIDPTITYVPANRYSKTVLLSGNGLQTFTLTAADFTNPAGTAIANGTVVYTFGVIEVAGAAHILTIGRVRQLPNIVVTYSPGALPFTANFLGTPASLVDWRGPSYCGYQSPWMWKQLGNETGVANSIQMLTDAQAAWTTQTGLTGVKGPFAPVYYFNRADAVQYGTVNSFGWNGPDPNTQWGGYQYRPLYETAALIQACNGTESYYSKAVTVADSFLSYLDSNWSSGAISAGVPTNFPMSAATTTYPEPHFLALIIRTVLARDLVVRPLGNTSGAMNSTYASLLSKAMTFWTYWYQSTGTMAGTFCTDTVAQTWFGFWHGEIMTTLSQLITWASNSNIGQITTATTATTWLNGMINFVQLNVKSSGTNDSQILANTSGGFQYKVKGSINEMYNGVKGKYISPANNWQQSDIPPYCQDATHGYTNGSAAFACDLNLQQDGGQRRWFDTQYPFTISSSMVQRLAKIDLLRRRFSGTATFAFNMWGYQIVPLDVVEFTLPMMRWQDKLFEVTGNRFISSEQTDNGTSPTLLGTEIDLRETDPGIYSWSTSEELTPQGYKQAVLPSRSGVATTITYGVLSGSPTITVNGV